MNRYSINDNNSVITDDDSVVNPVFILPRDGRIVDFFNQDGLQYTRESKLLSEMLSNACPVDSPRLKTFPDGNVRSSRLPFVMQQANATRVIEKDNESQRRKRFDLLVDLEKKGVKIENRDVLHHQLLNFLGSMSEEDVRDLIPGLIDSETLFTEYSASLIAVANVRGDFPLHSDDAERNMRDRFFINGNGGFGDSISNYNTFHDADDDMASDFSPTANGQSFAVQGVFAVGANANNNAAKLNATSQELAKRFHERMQETVRSMNLSRQKAATKSSLWASLMYSKISPKQREEIIEVAQTFNLLTLWPDKSTFNRAGFLKMILGMSIPGLSRGDSSADVTVLSILYSNNKSKIEQEKKDKMHLDEPSANSVILTGDEEKSRRGSINSKSVKEDLSPNELSPLLANPPVARDFITRLLHASRVFEIRSRSLAKSFPLYGLGLRSDSVVDARGLIEALLIVYTENAWKEFLRAEISKEVDRYIHSLNGNLEMINAAFNNGTVKMIASNTIKAMATPENRANLLNPNSINNLIHFHLAKARKLSLVSAANGQLLQPLHSVMMMRTNTDSSTDFVSQKSEIDVVLYSDSEVMAGPDLIRVSTQSNNLSAGTDSLNNKTSSEVMSPLPSNQSSIGSFLKGRVAEGRSISFPVPNIPSNTNNNNNNNQSPINKSQFNASIPSVRSNNKITVPKLVLNSSGAEISPSFNLPPISQSFNNSSPTATSPRLNTKILNKGDVAKSSNFNSSLNKNILNNSVQPGGISQPQINQKPSSLTPISINNSSSPQSNVLLSGNMEDDYPIWRNPSFPLIDYDLDSVLELDNDAAAALSERKGGTNLNSPRNLLPNRISLSSEDDSSSFIDSDDVRNLLIQAKKEGMLLNTLLQQQKLAEISIAADKIHSDQENLLSIGKSDTTPEHILISAIGNTSQNVNKATSPDHAQNNKVKSVPPAIFNSRNIKIKSADDANEESHEKLKNNNSVSSFSWVIEEILKHQNEISELKDLNPSDSPRISNFPKVTAAALKPRSTADIVFDSMEDENEDVQASLSPLSEHELIYQKRLKTLAKLEQSFTALASSSNPSDSSSVNNDGAGRTSLRSEISLAKAIREGILTLASLNSKRFRGAEEAKQAAERLKLKIEYEDTPIVKYKNKSPRHLNYPISPRDVFSQIDYGKKGIFEKGKNDDEANHTNLYSLSPNGKNRHLKLPALNLKDLNSSLKSGPKVPQRNISNSSNRSNLSRLNASHNETMKTSKNPFLAFKKSAHAENLSAQGASQFETESGEEKRIEERNRTQLVLKDFETERAQALLNEASSRANTWIAQSRHVLLDASLLILIASFSRPLFLPLFELYVNLKPYALVLELARNNPFARPEVIASAAYEGFPFSPLEEETVRLEIDKAIEEIFYSHQNVSSTGEIHQIKINGILTNGGVASPGFKNPFSQNFIMHRQQNQPNSEFEMTHSQGMATFLNSSNSNLSPFRAVAAVPSVTKGFYKNRKSVISVPAADVAISGERHVAISGERPSNKSRVPQSPIKKNLVSSASPPTSQILTSSKDSQTSFSSALLLSSNNLNIPYSLLKQDPVTYFPKLPVEPSSPPNNDERMYEPPSFPVISNSTFSNGEGLFSMTLVQFGLLCQDFSFCCAPVLSTSFSTSPNASFNTFTSKESEKTDEKATSNPVYLPTAAQVASVFSDARSRVPLSYANSDAQPSLHKGVSSASFAPVTGSALKFEENSMVIKIKRSSSEPFVFHNSERYEESSNFNNERTGSTNLNVLNHNSTLQSTTQNSLLPDAHGARIRKRRSSSPEDLMLSPSYVASSTINIMLNNDVQNENGFNSNSIQGGIKSPRSQNSAAVAKTQGVVENDSIVSTYIRQQSTRFGLSALIESLLRLSWISGFHSNNSIQSTASPPIRFIWILCNIVSNVEKSRRKIISIRRKQDVVAKMTKAAETLLKAVSAARQLTFAVMKLRMLRLRLGNLVEVGSVEHRVMLQLEVICGVFCESDLSASDIVLLVFEEKNGLAALKEMGKEIQLLKIQNEKNCPEDNNEQDGNLSSFGVEGKVGDNDDSGLLGIQVDLKSKKNELLDSDEDDGEDASAGWVGMTGHHALQLAFRKRKSKIFKEAKRQLMAKVEHSGGLNFDADQVSNLLGLLKERKKMALLEEAQIRKNKRERKLRLLHAQNVINSMAALSSADNKSAISVNQRSDRLGVSKSNLSLKMNSNVVSSLNQSESSTSSNENEREQIDMGVKGSSKFGPSSSIGKGNDFDEEISHRATDYVPGNASVSVIHHQISRLAPNQEALSVSEVISHNEFNEELYDVEGGFSEKNNQLNNSKLLPNFSLTAEESYLANSPLISPLSSPNAGAQAIFTQEQDLRAQGLAADKLLMEMDLIAREAEAQVIAEGSKIPLILPRDLRAISLYENVKDISKSTRLAQVALSVGGNPLQQLTHVQPKGENTKINNEASKDPYSNNNNNNNKGNPKASKGNQNHQHHTNKEMADAYESVSTILPSNWMLWVDEVCGKAQDDVSTREDRILKSKSARNVVNEDVNVLGVLASGSLLQDSILNDLVISALGE